MPSEIGTIEDDLDSVFVEFEGDIGLSAQINDFQNRSIKSEDPILCKIPNTIRVNHEKEYEPEIIAIGPYHRNGGGHLGQINPRLKHMEDMKLKFLIDLCKATANNNEDITKEDVLKTITTAVQKKAIIAQKKYFESSFDMSYEDFVKMLILDGSFIVEFFIKQEETRLQEIPMKFKDIALNSLYRDLLLFENQIPFFILETIHSCCFPTSNDNSMLFSKYTILNLALSYLHFHEMRLEMLSNEYLQKYNIGKVQHLLHLYHIGKVKGSMHHGMKVAIMKIQRFALYNQVIDTNDESETLTMIPTASQLKEHGIQFRKKEVNSSSNSLDISFKNGIMEIPHVNIEDNTSPIYRNLLILEQSCETYGNKFTSYVNFMDDLIDTTDDVALLTKNKILDNNLGSVDEVAKLFNEMCIGLSHDPKHHYLVEVYKEINRYCGKPVNKWWAKLMHNYFNSPWSIISLLGVSVLLILTIVQTTYSIKSFNNGN